MIETIVQVDGMMCGMCESHINDAVQWAFPYKQRFLLQQKPYHLF